MGAADNDDDLAVVAGSISDLEARAVAETQKLQSAQARLDVAFRGLDELVAGHAEQLKECRRLAKMIAQVRRESGGEGAQGEQLAESEEALERVQLSLDRVRDLKPKTGSVFLRLIMGRVNVRMWRRGEKLRFRDEYNKFKWRTTLIFLLLPVLQLLALSRGFGGDGGAEGPGGVLGLVWKAHQFWMLYYYASLAFRENILAANGSSIRPWWVYHHYVAFVATALTVFFPRALGRAYPVFLWFAVAQGLVMLLQNYYQRSRSYARRAVGKEGSFEVVGETIVEKPTTLRIMVPMLYALYAFELWFGWFLYTLNGGQLLGVALLLLWALLAVGNFATTSIVLFSKRRRRRGRKPSHAQ